MFEKIRFHGIARWLLAVVLCGLLLSLPHYIVEKVMSYKTDPINAQIASLEERHDQMQEQWHASKERFLALPALTFEERKELDVVEKQIEEQEHALEQEQQLLKEQLTSYDTYGMAAKGASFILLLLALWWWLLA